MSDPFTHLSQLRVLLLRVEQQGRQRGEVQLGGPRRPTHVLPPPAQQLPRRPRVTRLPQNGGG